MTSPVIPDQEKALNQWSVVVEYSKAIIALAAVLLGVTVTFAEKVLTGHQGFLITWALVVSWVLLLVTIVAGTLAAAYCINYLRKGTGDKLSILFSNIAIFALSAAGAAFLVVGVLRSFELSPAGARKAINEALGVMHSLVQPAQEWTVRSVEWLGSEKEYKVVLDPAHGQTAYVLIFDDDVVRLKRAVPLEEKRKQETVAQQDKHLPSLNIPGDIAFDTAQSKIRAAFRPALDALADQLNRIRGPAILIIGHTDNAGSPAYNQQLSLARAHGVRDYLASRSVAASRMTVEGKGETLPIAPNDTVEGRARNRRVEIKADR